MQQNCVGTIPGPQSAPFNDDARSAADELGLDRVGNLHIKIQGTEQKDYPDEKNVTVYRLLITGPGGSHTVFRRYKEFEELHQALFGQSTGHTELSTATMPPKSFFRKTFMQKFRDQRQSQLGEVARAALTEATDADLESCPAALRKFLGLDDTPRETWDRPGSAVAATQSKDPAAAITMASSSSSRATRADPETEASNKEERTGLLATFANTVENVVHKVEQKVENLIHAQTKEEPVPAIYRVHPDGTKNPGLYYRKAKVLDDIAKDTGALTQKYQPWGTCVVGILSSDGYLSVEIDDSPPVKNLYLYSKPNIGPPTECLKLVEEPMPAYYLLHNTNLQINTADVHGILYRKSKDMKDRMREEMAGATQAWDSLVLGVDEGDGWLKVGDDSEAKYLPMAIQGNKVLALKASMDKPMMKRQMLGCCAVCR